ncbi:unnamed protein product [Calypogeia fissa]
MSDDNPTVAAAQYKGPPVAVIGAGVAGCVAASSLAERGIPVRLFEMGRGPGGRLSTRREKMGDGTELLFDHGAQYMTVSYPSVQSLVDKWQAAGLVGIWQAKFGSFDMVERRYSEETRNDGVTIYVGVPGMNSFCKAMASQPGIKAEYNTMVVEMKWKEEGLWVLTSKNGESLGTYGAVVVADKALASSRFRAQTGLPPPLEDAGVPDLYQTLSSIGSVPCFTVMLAFSHPLTSVPFDRFTIDSSNFLAGAVRVSSKPGRKVLPKSESWVLYSSIDYALEIVNKEGFAKPSSASLQSIAVTLLKEFQEIVPEAINPIHVKAHRWGSSFPKAAVAPEEKCLVDTRKKIVACGDFCGCPRIEGAIVSGLAAADQIDHILKISTAKI